MIEVVYKEEKQEANAGENIFHVPRNIRQIGLAGGNVRIYIEDYVYTFLGRLADQKSHSKEVCGVAVFTGETKWDSGITYIFIRGALIAEDMEVTAEHIEFSEKIWEKIQENQIKYFPDQEVTGWFFSRPQMYLEAGELLTQVHLRHFGGEKVLMLMEPTEREDAFFLYENGAMAKQRGYYIYYEKNPQMQEYMIEKKQELTREETEKVEDEAVISFRKIIRNKKVEKTGKTGKTEEEPQKEMEHTSVFSYAATACLILALLAVGNGFYRNYKKIQDRSIESSATVISDKSTKTIGSAQTDGSTQTDGGTQIDESVQTVENTQVDESTENGESKIQNTAGVFSKEDVEYDKSEKNEDESNKNDNNERLESIQEIDTNTQNNTENSAVQETTEQEENETTEAQQKGTEQTEEETAVQETDSIDGFPQEADARKEKKSESVSSDDVYETYVIKPGDTLYQISISHYGNMDEISEICRLNNLTENQVIYPGETIILP